MSRQTPSETDYEPVSCELHSTYERLVMAGTPVQASWRDGQGRVRLVTALPRDVFTRNAAEYLLLECRSGETLELRLDRLVAVEPLPAPQPAGANH